MEGAMLGWWPFRRKKKQRKASPEELIMAASEARQSAQQQLEDIQAQVDGENMWFKCQPMQERRRCAR